MSFQDLEERALSSLGQIEIYSPARLRPDYTSLVPAIAMTSIGTTICYKSLWSVEL